MGCFKIICDFISKVVILGFEINELILRYIYNFGLQIQNNEPYFCYAFDGFEPY